MSTSAAHVFRSPLIPKADGLQGSPLSMASGESMTESIRKQQNEMRELFASLTPASSMPTPKAAAEKAIEAAFGTPPGISKPKKKKNKKTNKNLIEVLM